MVWASGASAMLSAPIATTDAIPAFRSGHDRLNEQTYSSFFPALP
jgi:hypothetical protein